MSDLDLDQIRARLRDAKAPGGCHGWPDRQHTARLQLWSTDVPALLTEVERLRAEPTEAEVRAAARALAGLAVADARAALRAAREARA